MVEVIAIKALGSARSPTKRDDFHRSQARGRHVLSSTFRSSEDPPCREAVGCWICHGSKLSCWSGVSGSLERKCSSDVVFVT
ncbi:hypothetical protein TNCV_2277671 [Trichonephila clavipes]|nr:hypothetical protein TNCV_2277671 [Trichonephila clavipes]